jgi:GrpB-like predicted nucleotidyltransferase (UPF0157 family)
LVRATAPHAGPSACARGEQPVRARSSSAIMHVMADPLLEPVVLSDPDPPWAAQAAAAAADLARVLKGLVPRIEHIGSTSVPIRGKAIIDLQIAVKPADIAEAVTRIERLGYQHHGDAGVPGRQYMTRRCAGRPSINVHVFARGNTLLEDNRLIRDYLRAHPDAAQTYVAAKDEAVAQGHSDLRSYSQAKGASVATLRETACREALEACGCRNR